jgi:type II secretory pathway component PulJ
MKQGWHRTCAGVALLEVVTALMVISIGLLGVVQMYQVGVGQIRQSQRRMVALRAIDNEIETLRAMPAGQRPAGDDLPWQSDVSALDVLVDPQPLLDVVPYTPSPGLTQVTVTLQWREGPRVVTREVVTLLGAAP